MKQVYLLPMLLGFVLLVSFQNCSQSSLLSASDLALQEAAVDKATQFDIGTRVRDVNELGVGEGIACPMIMCAAPPVNCHYEQDAETHALLGGNNGDHRDRRCGSSCGRLVCDKPGGIICPAIHCQAPAEGCRYSNSSEKKDVHGCNVTCGTIVCEERPPKLPPITEPPVELPPNDGIKVCPLYKCVAPAQGCHLKDNNKKDENGCNIGCGEIVCSGDDATEINPINVLPIVKRKKPIICPLYTCAAPSSIKGRNCEYSGVPAVDKDGCQIGCGIVACEQEM